MRTRLTGFGIVLCWKSFLCHRFKSNKLSANKCFFPSIPHTFTTFIYESQYKQTGSQPSTGGFGTFGIKPGKKSLLDLAHAILSGPSLLNHS